MDSKIHKWVNFQTERECWFALRWLNIVGKQNPPMSAEGNVDTLNRQINQILNSMLEAGTQVIRRDDKIRELEQAVKENILTDGDLSWLKRNAIATLCLWWQLRTHRHTIFFRERQKSFNNHDLILSTLSAEDELFTRVYTSHNERFMCIVHYLDSLIVMRSDKTYAKSELLNKIKREYINERPVRLSPSWLVQKDNDACKWAWKYITDYQKNHLLKNNKSDSFYRFPDGFFANGYHPDESSPGEYLIAIYAAFELWDERDDARELFITRMNRAWNQYTLRHTRKDKKPINCYVNSATKKRLEKYCKTTNQTITDVIEALINDHCKPPF